MTAAPNNPTPSPTQPSLAELFSRDPEKLTTSDLSAIVAAFRTARASFMAGKKSAGSRAQTGSKKLLNLDELGL